MVLLLFTDNSVVEIEECEEVVHADSRLVCKDHQGNTLMTFASRDIHGYTLDTRIMESVRRNKRYHRTGGIARFKLPD